jgi:hypothetical protein
MKKSTEIAIDLDMPVRVVQRVKQTWLQIGQVCRSRDHIGRHPLLSPEQTKVSFIQNTQNLCAHDYHGLLLPLTGHVGLDRMLTRYLP